jgi:hypothetical protein
MRSVKSSKAEVSMADTEGIQSSRPVSGDARNVTAGEALRHRFVLPTQRSPQTKES